MTTFRIPYPPNMAHYCKRYGLNAYWSGKHWGQRKKDAEEVHCIVRAALMAQKIPKRLSENPVKITFFHNTRMDIDNHAAIEKMIVDGLKGYLIADDGRRHFVEKTSRFHNENFMLVVVEEA